MIAIDEIEAARERIAGIAVRTPLVQLPVNGAEPRIYCKLETLQPINSFKLRGAANAVLSAPPDVYAKGLITASAGNMAQGVAWMARELGVPATIVVPEHAPRPSSVRSQRWAGGRSRFPTKIGGRRSSQAEWRGSPGISCTQSMMTG